LRYPASTEAPKQYAECTNVPPIIAAIVSKGIATIKDIRETYGMGDVWDMWEIVSVTNYNEYIANKRD